MKRRTLRCNTLDSANSSSVVKSRRHEAHDTLRQRYTKGPSTFEQSVGVDDRLSHDVLLAWSTLQRCNQRRPSMSLSPSRRFGKESYGSLQPPRRGRTLGDRYTSFNDVTPSGSKCHSSPPLCIIEATVGSACTPFKVTVPHLGKGQAASSKGVRAEKAADCPDAMGGMLGAYPGSRRPRSYC